VDHEILMNRLEHWVGLKGNFLSYGQILVSFGGCDFCDIFLGESHKGEFLLQFFSPSICYCTIGAPKNMMCFSP